jgi:hypothetical protein
MLAVLWHGGDRFGCTFRSLELQSLDVELSRLVSARIAPKSKAMADDTGRRSMPSRIGLRRTIAAQEALTVSCVQHSDEGEIFASRKLKMEVLDTALSQRYDE